MRDLLYLMITLSDNTATDMLWRLVGLGSVNLTMRQLRPGDHRLLPAQPRVLPHRVRRRRGVGRASAGRRSSPAGARSRRAGSYEDAFRRVLDENARLSGAGFLHLYERRWGRDESLGYEDAFVVDQALDNKGSPRDMAELLAMIAQGRCAVGAVLPVHGRGASRSRSGARRYRPGCPKGCSWPTRPAASAAPATTPRSSTRRAGHHWSWSCSGRASATRRRAARTAAIAEIAAVLYEHLGEPA